jgi:Holliday junction resolvase RusA-like endonuclease
MTEEYKEKIVDVVTGEITWRDYTDEEIAIHNAKKAELAKEKEDRDKLEKSRLDILEKLGLTQDEAKVLLG